MWLCGTREVKNRKRDNNLTSLKTDVSSSVGPEKFRNEFVRLTCSLNEPWVRVVWDDGNRQIPQVQFECARNDVDVFIGLPWDVCLLAICEVARWKKKDEKKEEKADISKSHHSVKWREKKIVLLWVDKKIFCSVFCKVAAIIRLACFLLTSPLLCMLSREAMAYLCRQTEHRSAASDTLSWMISHMRISL